MFTYRDYTERKELTRSFPVKSSGLYVDQSLSMNVVVGWLQLFEVNYETAVTLGDKVLYLGKDDEYDRLVEIVKNHQYDLGLDKDANLYLIFEAEIIE